jgi:hypothetical protein
MSGAITLSKRASARKAATRYDVMHVLLRLVETAKVRHNVPNVFMTNSCKMLT